METLGHSQIALAANLYGHLYADRRREIASRLDEMFSNGRALKRSQVWRCAMEFIL
jgi:hypothetical protein